MTDDTFALTAHADSQGWDLAFGPRSYSSAKRALVSSGADGSQDEAIDASEVIGVRRASKERAAGFLPDRRNEAATWPMREVYHR